MASDLLFTAVNVLHRGVLKATGGRVGGRLKRMPVVELTTTGRRSGEPRTVLLTSPLQRDGAYVVVASRGGDDRHPAWFLNLRDDPSVTVAARGRSQPMRARIPTGAERRALWAEVTDRFPHYGRYQDRTDREIPLVVLEAP